MSGVTIVVCFILLFYIVVPIATNWLSIRKEVVATQQRIAILQQNITFINNLDKGTLNAQLQTASHALPSEKDFGAMLQSISNAAQQARISLSDYSFQVGNLAASANSAVSVHDKGLSTIQVAVVVNGSVDGVRKFIVTLENSLPIAEITNIDGSGKNVTVTIQYYQKPFQDIKFTGDTPLGPVTAEKLGLLQQLSKWDLGTRSQNISQPTNSGSAVPLF